MDNFELKGLSHTNTQQMIKMRENNKLVEKKTLLKSLKYQFTNVPGILPKLKDYCWILLSLYPFVSSDL